MYDELVKRLRNCSTQAAPCKTCGLVEDGSRSDTLMKQAADAIEELQAQLMFSNDAAKAIAEKVPKWIPVTERLPVKGEWVLTYSKYVKPMTDFIDKHGSWYRTPAVTHWMPLPQPPKEDKDADN